MATPKTITIAYYFPTGGLQSSLITPGISPKVEARVRTELRRVLGDTTRIEFIKLGSQAAYDNFHDGWHTEFGVRLGIDAKVTSVTNPLGSANNAIARQVGGRFSFEGEINTTAYNVNPMRNQPNHLSAIILHEVIWHPLDSAPPRNQGHHHPSGFIDAQVPDFNGQFSQEAMDDITSEFDQ